MMLPREVKLRRNTCEKKPIALFSFLVVLCCVASQASRTLKCDFNSRMCSWANIQDSTDQDDFNWKLGRGKMGEQRRTGASYDHGGDGGYMFIKSKSRGNRTAKLVSPPITKTSPTCFEFWYYMRGKTLGHLAIYTTTNRRNVTENSKLLWNLNGHQASMWLNAKVPLGPLQRTHIIIEAFDWAKGKNGNILIDDTSLKLVSSSTSCVLTPSYAKPKAIETTAGVTTTMSTIMVTKATTVGISTDSATTQVTTQPNRVGQMTRQSPAVGTATDKDTNTPKPSQTNRSETATSSPALITSNNNSNQTAGGPMFVEANPHGHMVGIVVSVVLVVAVLLVALAYYMRRRKRPASMYADDCSVTMTRMYPSIAAATDYHVDYRKLT